MYTTNIRPKSEVRGSLLLINLEPEGRGVYQWQTSNDQGQGSYVCCIHRNGRGSYDIYYDEVILGCIIQQKPVTMFSTHCISFPSDSAAF